LNSGFLSQFQPDLLDQLSGAVDIAVIGDAYREFVDGPVAALVLDGAQQAERHGVKRAALMPQLDRADAEALDGALVIAALDVFADPKGVVEQVEHASDDIADKILTTKADRNPDNTQTGDQRADFEAHRRQRHQRGDGDDHDEQNIAENRQQRTQPRPPPRLVGVRLTQVLGLGLVPAYRCRFFDGVCGSMKWAGQSV
jgi:hypothetical protein